MKFLLPFLLIFSLNTFAEDSFKIWGGVFSKSKINNKVSFWIEDQLRLNGDKIAAGQFLFRTGPLIQIKESQEVGLLYAFIKTGNVSEHRYALQHVLKFNSNISHRARLEMRTFEDLKPKTRARYLLRGDFNNIVIWDEVFVHITPDSDFDRNRLFLGYKSNFENFRLEYGYLSQITSNVTEHVATVYAFF